MDSEYYKFIRGNIKELEVQPHKIEHEGPSCPCGKPRVWEGHVDDEEEGNETLGYFNTELHLKETPATCYGSIRFENYDYNTVNTLKPYIRVSYRTDPGDLLQIMTDYWNLPAPRLIISVTGGAQMFDISHRHLRTFKRYLVKAATTADAWIITGGMEAGVMSLVGEAISDHVHKTRSTSGSSMVAIGIASWGALDNKDSLANKDPVDSANVKRIKKIVNPEVHHKRSSRRVSMLTQTSLDPNHSHFILVDDGTEGQFGGEIKMRALLEEHISQNVLMISDETCNVPVVMIVVEGGVGTINTAIEGARRNTSVIVLEGSGRAADLIAYAWRLKQNRTMGIFDLKHKSYTFSRDIRNNVRDKARSALLIFDDALLDDIVSKVDELLRMSDLVTIIPFGAEDMDRSMFEALVKANQADILTQLKLAMIWNVTDVNSLEVFGSEIRTITRQSSKYPHLLDPLYESMFAALVYDRPEFVHLFMENGFVMSHFLTAEMLADLYWEKGDKEAILQTVGNLLKKLSKGMKLESYRGITLKRDDDKPTRFEEPEKHLFLWAVLTNRSDMAKTFWRVVADPTASAIVATCLFKEMSAAADMRAEVGLSQTLRCHAEEYEVMATAVLKECYKLDMQECHNLLTRRLDSWGEETIMSMASQAGCMEFLQHASVQTKLDRIWMGGIAPRVSLKRLWLTILAPMFSMCIIKFELEEDMNLEKANVVSPHNHNSCKSSKADKKMKEKEDDEDGEPAKKYCGCCSGTIYNIPLCLIYWYLFMTAPFVKFCYHSISFLSHIILLCLMILTELDAEPFSPSRNPLEILVWIFSATIFIEEIRQAFPSCSSRPNEFCHTALSYFTEAWNMIDFTMLLALLVSVILRFTLSREYFEYVQMFYVLATLAAFVRFLQIWFLSRKVGPLIVMVWEMILDMFYFLAILFNIMMAYGVAQQAIHFPRAGFNWYTIWRAFHRAYWFFGQSTELEELTGDLDAMKEECRANGTSFFKFDADYTTKCEMLHYSWMAIALDGLYILIVNVLLMNLVIAMFAQTFKKVQKNSEKLWRYYRYSLIEEYFDKPLAAPPVNIIYYFIKGIVFFASKTCCKSIGRIEKKFARNKFRKAYNDTEEYKALSSFERAGLDEYLFSSKSSELESGLEAVTRNTFNEILESLNKQSAEIAAISKRISSTERNLKKIAKHFEPQQKNDANTEE